MWVWIITLLLEDETDLLICSAYAFARYQDAVRHFNNERDNIDALCEEKGGLIVEIEITWFRNNEAWEVHRWN